MDELTSSAAVLSFVKFQKNRKGFFKPNFWSKSRERINFFPGQIVATPLVSFYVELYGILSLPPLLESHKLMEHKSDAIDLRAIVVTSAKSKISLNQLTYM